MIVKIVFSRKGFDSSAGGFPSLIFPDGSLFSIPIPSSSGNILYNQIDFLYQGTNISEILNEVTGNRIRAEKVWRQCDYQSENERCHCDPCILPTHRYLSLGQAEAAESHLRNQGVGSGDVFFFYGWFRQVQKGSSGKWEYRPGSPHIHLIWSWMRIAERIKADRSSEIKGRRDEYPDMALHPHLSADWNQFNNSIYRASESSIFLYDNRRCLTDTKNGNSRRSQWRLPGFFNQPGAFSCLKDFTEDGVDVIIKYRGYGQEFVLDLDKVPSSRERDMIAQYMKEIMK